MSNSEVVQGITEANMESARKKSLGLVVVKDLCSRWIQSCPTEHKTVEETMKSLQKFVPPEQEPSVIYTDSSLEFIRACEDLCWNRGKSTPYRSEPNGIAENAVRRVKEGTSALLVFQKSGAEKRWNAPVILQTYKTHCGQKVAE